MNEVLFIYFYFVISLLFLIIGVNFCFKKGLLAAKFIGADYLVMTWLIFVSYFTNSARILEYPHFYRLSTPFVYLIVPLGYLFQEYLLNPARRYKKRDLWHFAPFALTLISLIPFYVSPGDVKVSFIQEVMKQQSLVKMPASPSGWISMQTHLTLRSIQFIVYQIAIMVHLWKFYQGKSAQFIRANRLVLNWVLLSVVLKFITKVFLITLTFFHPRSFFFSFHWFDLMKIMDYIVVAIYLLLNPRLLDGKSLKELVINKLNRSEHFEEIEANKLKSGLDDFAKIEKLLLESEAYLNENITLQSLSEQINIPARKISAALKKGANLSFPDYINSLRILYIEQKLRADQEWMKYTFEAMAFECGFGSRSNFYQAFKKLKGLSPKAYFESLS